MTSIPKYLSIGNRITSIRNIANLKQAQFAKSLGISRPALSAIETGHTKPSMPILYVLEFKYNYRHEWVLTGDGEMYNDPLLVKDTTPEYRTSNRALMAWTSKLIRIFDEGDDKKIEAIKAALRALDPVTKNQDLLKQDAGSMDEKEM